MPTKNGEEAESTKSAWRATESADVGISVDSAVDIANESADVILLQKSLIVLEEGVMEAVIFDLAFAMAESAADGEMQRVHG